MMRNYGQHNALLCGLRAAKYEITITMDDDLQHPPEEIGILLAKFCDDFDVVYGIPNKLPHSLWRNLFSLLTKRLLAFVTNIPTVRYAGSFRALRTNLRDAFATFQSPNVILDVLLSWGTTRFTTVQVDESPREVGSSNYNFVKLFSHSMSILIGFSTAPLRLASMIGFAFTILGIIIFAYVIILFFIAGSIPGFPFLASIISLFSGTQLFALGIFGEYLATVFDRSMERPVYMIRETTGKDETH
jgi:undecaprenyl-phosphate 4-deoxy-4-formamido-L-arabinose transferase